LVGGKMQSFKSLTISSSRLPCIHPIAAYLVYGPAKLKQTKAARAVNGFDADQG
jgi:hypothetical protein